jgi:hypothetical protein
MLRESKRHATLLRTPQPYASSAMHTGHRLSQGRGLCRSAPAAQL